MDGREDIHWNCCVEMCNIEMHQSRLVFLTGNEEENAGCAVTIVLTLEFAVLLIH